MPSFARTVGPKDRFIREGQFYNRRFEEREAARLVLPDSVVTIGNCAFEKCNAEHVQMGNRVGTIGVSAFKNCFFI